MAVRQCPRTLQVNTPTLVVTAMVTVSLVHHVFHVGQVSGEGNCAK